MPQPDRAFLTVRNLVKRFGSHTALADVHESIDELVHYREHFLR